MLQKCIAQEKGIPLHACLTILSRFSLNISAGAQVLKIQNSKLKTQDPNQDPFQTGQQYHRSKANQFIQNG